MDRELFSITVRRLVVHVNSRYLFKLSVGSRQAVGRCRSVRAKIQLFRYL